MLGLSSTELLTAVAYVLLLAANIPLVAQYKEFGWALVPLWLIMTGYTASILKSVTRDKERSKRYAGVVWLVWVTYYTLAVMWPLPLHWYDALVVSALFAVDKSLLSSGLLATYYTFSAAAYAKAGDALQVTGRVLLTCLMAQATVVAYQEQRLEEHRQIL